MLRAALRCSSGWAGVLVLICAILLPAVVASAQSNYFRPFESDLGGGISVDIDIAASEIFFGDVPATDIVVYRSCVEDPETCYYTATCKAPPQLVPGPVKISLRYPDGTVVLPGDFTYLPGPEPSSISPQVHSIIEDDTPVRISGRGFSVLPGVQVLFGGVPAAAVTVDAIGHEITCIPPPFTSGDA